MTDTMILEKVTIEREQRRRQRDDQWRALVVEVADGKLTKPSAVLDALEKLGKSEDDLAAAIERHRRRQEARRLLDLIPGQQRRLAEVRQDLQRHTEALREAQRKYEAAVGPLLVEERELLRATDKADDLRQQILRDCPDQDLAAALCEAEKESVRLADLVGKLTPQARDLRKSVQRWEASVAESKRVGSSRLPQQEVELADGRRKLERTEAELALAQPAAVEASERLEQLMAQVLAA